MSGLNKNCLHADGQFYETQIFKQQNKIQQNFNKGPSMHHPSEAPVCLVFFKNNSLGIILSVLKYYLC